MSNNKFLINILQSDPDFSSLCESYKKGCVPISVNGICESARPLFCSALCENTQKKPLILVSDEKQAYALQTKLTAFWDSVLVFPSRDFVFDSLSAFSKNFEQERISVLTRLLKNDYSAIIAVPDAVMQYTPPVQTLKDSVFTLKHGATESVDFLVARLVEMGYFRCETVEGAGQFSHRGGIVDIFSPSKVYPCRLDFWGDEIDSMGIFDVVTQRRIENVDEYECIPTNELIYKKDVFAKLVFEIEDMLDNKSISEKTRVELTRDLDSAKSQIFPLGKDKYFSLVYEKKTTIFDYMQSCITIIFDTKRVFERARAFSWQNGQTLEAMINDGRTIYKNAAAALFENELVAKLAKDSVSFDYFFENQKEIDYKSNYNILTKTVGSCNGSIEQLVADIKEYISLERQTVVLMCANERAAENMIAVLCEKQINAIRAVGNFEKGVVNIIISPSKSDLDGFELPKCRFTLISDGEESLKTDSLRRKFRASKFKKSEKIVSYADLSIGDYVVHANHGIGIYAGISGLTFEGAKKDYIKIQYAGSDVLYVPCNQLDMVSKYIGAGAEAKVKLSNMGSKEWQRAKSRAKSAAKNIAKELILLYAARKNQCGYAFPPDCEYQDEFESAFEYSETDGQLTSTEEIKADMESSVPMDRLLCGDVGFGKTEVALRAAFKAVCDGKQVAILVPTTILALQHYNTMKSRFRGFPVAIGMLSRFKTKKEQDNILPDLKNGKLDIIVGTHKLLQKSIEFKDLGLLVIDEEQRFGVSHKEKLKALAVNVDTLTLTATPIPRTLNMALSGIRDMSVLEEAPQDRVPVQSFVLEHDDEIIYEAIRRELRRGGQVFYLHNVVDSMYGKASELAKQFPSATVGVANGQMDKNELSDIWHSMVNGEIDILVCTTIIETGVDIPNANTLIIEEANKMGLSQLHQIRGRVGRSPRRAYAYFTYRAGSLLSEIATKRLGAIKEFTEFGSGFKIAMRDLELRGAGNLLGAEQSGHMAAIGYDLYIKILEEAVNEEKGIINTVKRDCLIEIICDAYIPDDYISSSQQRIDMYRKIALLDTKEDRDDLVDEFLDRFGELPESVSNLLDISLSRNIASALGINHISQKGDLISFYVETIDVEKCSRLTTFPELVGRVMISATVKPHFAIKLRSNDKSTRIVMQTLSIYASLSQN